MFIVAYKRQIKMKPKRSRDTKLIQEVKMHSDAYNKGTLWLLRWGKSVTVKLLSS